LQGAADQFAQAGANLVLIGQATPNDAADFRRQFKLELPLLADEQRVSYKAIGARYAGISGIFGPKIILRGLQVILGQRVRQGKTIGASNLLGAAAVIAPDGEVLYEHLARDVSDNAPPEEMLAALARTPA
jgi:peroxiredoxin